MKAIKSFDDALHYCNRLGFAGSGNIQGRQDSLVRATEALLRASGQTSWYQKEFKPFKVEFHRYKETGFGHGYPWLSSFDIVRSDGTKTHLDMSRVKS